MQIDATRKDSEFSKQIKNTVDVLTVRDEARRLATRSGYSAEIRWLITAAASEVGSMLIASPGHGTISLSITEDLSLQIKISNEKSYLKRLDAMLPAAVGSSIDLKNGAGLPCNIFSLMPTLHLVMDSIYLVRTEEARMEIVAEKLFERTTCPETCGPIACSDEAAGEEIRP